jgi:type I restriction-modification system DNA methylase subunit
MSLNHVTQSSQLTDEHFKAIGKIVTEWANIESLLCVTLARLLLTPDFLGRSYTDRMTAAKIQEAIDEALDLHMGRYCYDLISKQMVDEITKINRRITKLRSTRNKFAHFCWCRWDDEQIFGMNFSGGLPMTKKHQKSSIKLKISEINSLYQEFYEIVEKLNQITYKLPEIDEKELFERLARRVRKERPVREVV